MNEQPEQPMMTEAEITAFEAERAALRAQLRAMAEAESPPVGARYPTSYPAPVPPQPATPAIVKAEPVPDPRIEAALAQRQAMLDAMPKNAVAKALVPLLEDTWLQERHVTMKPRPRTNEDRATEGGILCHLTGMLSGSIATPEQAIDAMANIMHALRRAGMDSLDIGELMDMANSNFVAEVNEEEDGRINQVQTRTAPAWAWAGIDAALSKITDPFNPPVLDPVEIAATQNSFLGMKYATDQPGLTELTLDELAHHPQFAEIEQPQEGGDA